MSSILQIGSKIRVVSLPNYIKTADPRPMLRPPQILSIGQEGLITDRRPGNFWVVKFTQGSFLMEEQYLELEC
jgi:Protein of unknown function (DUF3148)